MEDFLKGIGDIEKRDKEKTLQIVVKSDTCERLNGDGCERPNRVTVMKYYTVKPREYFEDRHYERHKGVTFTKYEIDVPPRKFYREYEIKGFMERMEKKANRKIEDAEWGILLRTITSGRHYKLIGLMDRTVEFNKHYVWEDIK